MSGPRIVCIGGGSYHWTPRILTDLANTPTLVDAEVVLYDIDLARAETMAELGQAIATRRGIGLTVRAEADRRPALAGADFVVTSFSVGGFDSMRHDLEIPERYGIVQPIGDSVGPGGIMRALRSIPVLLDIAHDVEAIAPDAWLLNVTNPLTALCRAVTQETACKTVGLCNEFVGATFVLSLLFDCGLHEIDAVLAGVNHFPIATALTVRGSDAFEPLRALLRGEGIESALWMEPPPAMGWEKVSSGPHWTKGDVLANNAVRVELFRRFGVFVCSGDHHSTEFVPGFVHEANDHGANRRVHIYRLARHMADAAEDVTDYEALRDAEDVSTMPSGELVVSVIDALNGGRPRRLPVNVPNRSNVTNLPEGAVVEVMAELDESGVHARDNATVPGVMGEWLRRVNIAQELTVEAARSGDAELVLEAMLADSAGAALGYDDVVAMTDEMLTATAPWLPQFARR